MPDTPIHNEAVSGSVGSNAYLDSNSDFDPLAAKVDLQTRMDDYESLCYVHPDYEANVKKWKKYEDCYEAENVYRFLHQHPRESKDMFDIRLKRGYFYNYCASVVDLIVAYLFHAPIERMVGSTIQTDLGEIYKDADMCGSTYTNFMQEVASFAQIYGHCGVLVDAPQSDNVETEEDRKEQGIRPYLTIVKPTQIKDWALDRHGRFLWVKIEICRDDDRDRLHAVSDSQRRFLIWSRTDWEEWSVDDEQETASKVANGEHDLGQVPLIIFRNERAKNHRWFGSSMLRDIADINIALMNWSSLGDEEIAERCLNILTMESNGQDTPEVLSHHNILEYMVGSKPPEYLVPGETPLELIGNWIDRAKDEIYRLSKLSGSTGLLGVREATSGIAYAYEFNETNQSLAKKAEGMEQGEIEVHRMIARWLGKEWDGSITYPREFGVDDFLQQLSLLSEARGSLTSVTAIRELEKKITAKMFARDSMELRSTIKTEIESSDPHLVGFAENFNSVPGALTRGAVEDSPESSDNSVDESGDE